MPHKTPSYRERKGYQQAIVTLTDSVTRERRDYWLGEYGTPASRERYHRTVADWEANQRRLPAAAKETSEAIPSITVAEIVDAYWQWAEPYYRRSQAQTIRLALRALNQSFGSTPAAQFGPNSLRLVRQSMVEGTIDGLVDEGGRRIKRERRRWSRMFVNRQVQNVVAVFKWAAAREMCSASIFEQLKTLESLRRGKTAAPETAPVKPVDHALVDPIQPFVSKQVWALIELQRLTGARCGELFNIRVSDVERNDESGVWTFSPEHHKTEHHGKKRTILFGPKAQDVLRPYLKGRDVEAFLFSPKEAEEERRAEVHANRKTPLSCGNRPGTNRKGSVVRIPGELYTTATYRRAIARACEMAFPVPEHLARMKIAGAKGRRWETSTEWRRRLGEKRWQEVRSWNRSHSWHPHQLRHTAATMIRRQFGLEAAQIALGHSSALVTEAVYAQRDLEKVQEVMKRFG